MKKITYCDVYGNNNAISITVDEHDLTFEISLNNDERIRYVVIDKKYAYEIANQLIDMYMKEDSK